MGEYQLTPRNFLERKGEKVYLKPLSKEYIEEYWQGLNNSSIETTIFTGTQQLLKRDNLEQYLDRISADGNRVDFLIFATATDELVGEVVINDIYRNNRSANLRIAINQKDDFGRGYGTEAMILALNYGFGMFNLHRVELNVLAANERAIRAYEKVGFQREGVQRDYWYFNHQYHDMVMMSILENEFRDRYQSSHFELKDFL